jgi:YCII-related domain
MANYLLTYKGGGMPENEAEGQKVMEAWMAWFGGLGAAVVDGGNPCGPSKNIAANGTVTDGAPSQITGYSVVKADSLDAATKMAKGCPILASGGSVEVYETYDAM